MKSFFLSIVIMFNLFVVILLLQQIRARHNVETEVQYLSSLVNSIDAEAVKKEDRLIGKKVPSFSDLTSLDNNQTVPKDLASTGSKIVILFSSLSCQTCLDDIQQFWDELPKLVHGKKIKLFAIANGTSRSEVRIFARVNGVKIPVVFDQDVKVTTNLGLEHHTVAVLLVNNLGKITLAYVSTSANPTLDREKIFLKKLKNILELEIG